MKHYVKAIILTKNAMAALTLIGMPCKCSVEGSVCTIFHIYSNRSLTFVLSDFDGINLGVSYCIIHLRYHRNIVITENTITQY